MAIAGARRSETVTKIMLGSDKGTRRSNDEAVQTGGTPEPQPGEVLTDAERELWDWFLRGLPAAVTSRCDGNVLLTLVRIQLRIRALERAAMSSPVMTGEGGNAMMNPAHAALNAAS